MIKFAMLLLGLSQTPEIAEACQPPDLIYLDRLAVQAISNSDEVWSKLRSGESIVSIVRTSYSEYVLKTKSCSLEIKIKTERVASNRPCGGPIKLIAVPGAECRGSD